MKKFLLGLAVGFLLAGLTLVILFFALLRAGDRRPAVADGSTLILDLEGMLPEQPPLRWPLPGLGPPPVVTVHETWDLLRKAATDQRIKAVLLRPANLQVGWGKLEEVRLSLERYKQSGKPLLVFLRNPGSREYYLATAADRVWMTREDLLDLKGFRAEVLYLRRTLDKLGIQVEIEHAGRYKDAGDIFTRTSMSPETREVMDSILDHVYGHFVETVAAARKKTPEAVRAALDAGPLLAHQSVERGLVDELIFEDEVYEAIRKQLGQERIVKLSRADYLRVPASTLGLEGRARIAMLVGQGVILRGSGRDYAGAEAAIYSETFIAHVRRLAKDDRIRGIILRIDSPGGDAIASDEILRELRLLAERKPVVVSMSDTAASGGYYIAMTGGPVLAYASTITGSIGVLYGKANLRGLYEKLGVRKEILTRGRYADIDSDYQPLSDAGRRKLREGVEKTYVGFLDRVAEGRKRPVGEIEPLAQGRAWLGAQAQSRALVDELGGVDRAIELVKEKAGIPAEEKIRLLLYPPPRSVLDVLLGDSSGEWLEANLQRLAPGFDLRPWNRGGLLRLMPYRIEIR